MKVCISPKPPNRESHAGVERLVIAQYEYLPQFGVKLVDDWKKADLLVSHIAIPKEWGNAPTVICSAGLYWTGDIGSGKYDEYHHKANFDLVQNLRRALKIAVPSDWVAECFRRDMRINPYVIGHGINAGEWTPSENGGYVLWNKNRSGDVCDPTPAYFLAENKISTVSTFGLTDQAPPEKLRLTGNMPHSEMKKLIQSADVYLATTKETFGIGTLEALAAGIPVLGYDWGGTHDIVRHGVDGFLVQPGNLGDLLIGYDFIHNNRSMLSEAARQRAGEFSWEQVMQKYVGLFQDALSEKKRPDNATVVITTHDYAQYVTEAIESALSQSYPATTIVVVDDGSTDNTQEVLNAYRDNPKVTLIRQENQGVAAARNNGIRRTNSPYIICLDADDKLHPEAVKTYVKALAEDRGLGIVYGASEIFSGKGEPENTIAYPPAIFSWPTLTTPTVGNELPHTCIYSGAMFRRDMWERCGGYKQVYAPGEDTEFWVRGLSVGFTAAAVSPLPLFYYRWHEGSASRTRTYVPISSWHPWFYDKQYPLAAPSTTPPIVRSYSEPEISVITPVGEGHVKYLPSALDSLLGQSFREWEIVIVDDTLRGIPPSVLRSYPFVKLVRTSGGIGAGAARNLGVKKSQASLLLFLDADDILYPDALKSMLQAMVDSGQRYVYTDWCDLIADKSTPRQAADYTQKVWLDNGVHSVTVLMRRDDFLGVSGFDEQLPGWEEGDLFTKLAISGVCGNHLRQTCFGYRRNAGKRRENSFANKDGIIHVLSERYKEFTEGGKPMAGCCGGGGNTILATKLGTVDGSSVSDMMTPSPAGFTKMEYTGDKKGGVTYHANGRSYIGADDDTLRYANVRNEDVDHLLITGRWRLYTPPPSPVNPAPIPEQRPAAPETLPFPTVREADPEPPADDLHLPVVEPPVETTEVEEPVAPKKRGRPRKHQEPHE